MQTVSLNVKSIIRGWIKMKLREQIFKILKDDWLTQQEPMDYRLDMQTRRIVSMIEKRIDKMIDNNLHVIASSYYHSGYNKALTEVKELLK
jgi:hypothetical protein